ncbi:MAG: histidine utilization repressor [Desulfobacteraceae bacterium]|nr:histidine utilization repressor [Desulfobacteraceae bacterium]
MSSKEKGFAIYEKIKLSIREQIDSGKLKPGDRVSSEIELANMFKASRMTANRALKELTAEGRIIRIQGVGSFVAKPKPEMALLEIKSIADEISKWGGIHSADIILLEEETVSKDIARKMNIKEGDKVFHSILVHKDEGIPVQYTDRFINPRVVPKYLEQDFSKMTPTEYLLEVAPVQEAQHIIEAIIPPQKIQKLLKIQPEEPCISIKRKTWSFDLIAAYSMIIYPGSKYKLSGKFRRDEV